MLTTSLELKNAFMQSERTISIRIKIGVRIFDNDDVISVEYDSGSLAGEVFAIGSAYSNSIKITFSNLVEGLKELDEVSYEIGIELPNGMIEYVPMGIFVINEAIEMDRNNNKTTIECMDRMVMMGGAYVSSLTYPAPIREVALEIANKAGIQVSDTFDRLSADKIAKPKGYTYREAIGLIAQFEAGFATFDRYGKLTIRALSDPNFAIPPDNYFSKGLIKNEVFFRLGGISCTTDDSGDAIIQSGNTLGNQIVLENRVMTKPLLDKIYQKIQLINYYPFSLKWQGNPILEAGDWIEIEDLEGNKFKTPNLNYKLTFNGGLSAESSAETATQSNATYQYKSPLQQKIEWINARIDAAGGNVIFEGIDQPSNPKEGDLWFKVVGPDKEILIYKKKADGTLFWEPQISTADIDKVSKEVDAVIADMIIEKERINQTIIKADQAIADASFAGINANQAKTDATTALENANQAKIDANTAITNSGTALTKAETALLDLKNQEIGVRNMLLNSRTPLMSGSDQGNNNKCVIIDNYVSITPINNGNIYKTNFSTSTDRTNGKDYIFSLEVNTKQAIGMLYRPGNWFDLDIIPNTNGEWLRVYYLYKHTGTTALKGSQFLIGFTGLVAGNELRYRNLMIAEGNIKRDWTPAPEDVEVQITNIDGELSRKVSQTIFDTLDGKVTNQGTEITQTKNMLSSKADSSTVNTLSGTVSSQGTLLTQTASALASKADSSVVNTLSGTVATQGTLLTQTANGLTSKAESSLVNTIKGTVETHSTQISQNATAISARLTSAQVDSLVAGKGYATTTALNATSTSLSASIVEVSTDLKNLEIGGRNLWNGSAYNQESVLNTYQTTGSFSQLSNVTIDTSLPENLDVEFTISFWAKSPNGITQLSIYNQNGNPRYFYFSKLLDNTLNVDWKYYTYTFTNIDRGMTFTSLYKNRIEFYAPGKAGVIIKNVKVEKGNKATDWTPAPEDMATVERAVAIEVNLNGLQTTVSNKAEQSQVTQLAGQISTKVESATYNSKMTQLDSSINLRVTASQVDASILSDKKIKDTRGDNQPPSWYFTNYPNQEVREFKQRTTLGVTVGSDTYGVLTTNVPWSSSSGGHVVQVFETGTGVFTRRGQFTGWTAWEQSAEVSKLVAQINLSPSGVYIQGKNIQLDGNVAMDNAFVNRIKAIEVIADKITSGTLNAANVNIINLNANRIATGTITGANSDWNLNTGNQTFKNPSTGDSLILSQGAIQFQNGSQTRLLEYTAEGLKLSAGAGNTGTSLNASLHLNGGVSYVQFNNRTGTVNNGRIQMTSDSATIQIPNGAFLAIRDRNNLQAGISVNYVTTEHNTGSTIQMAGDSIKTPRAGNRNIYIAPNGTGSVVAGEASGGRYNMVASDFVKQSTRDSKTNIKSIESRGLDVINRLSPVSYKKRDKVAQGIIETELGFIAEDSLEVATPDGLGVYDSHITAYLVKAVQELDVRTANETDILKERVAKLEQKIKLLESAA